MAERHAIPFADLAHVFIDARAVQRIPRSVALKYKLIPIEIQDHTLVVGISDPLEALPEKEIAELAQVAAIKTVLCTPEAVAAAIESNYGEQPAGIGTAS